MIIRQMRQVFGRGLLVVMLTTLLSPTVGWGMVATPDQLAHAGVSKSIDEHDHDHGPLDNHDHQDAHSFIGHVLTHMPFGYCYELQVSVTLGKQPEFPDQQFSIRRATLVRPFRPPRSFLFA